MFLQEVSLRMKFHIREEQQLGRIIQVTLITMTTQETLMMISAFLPLLPKEGALLTSNPVCTLNEPTVEVSCP